MGRHDRRKHSKSPEHGRLTRDQRRAEERDAARYFSHPHSKCCIEACLTSLPQRFESLPDREVSLSRAVDVTALPMTIGSSASEKLHVHVSCMVAELVVVVWNVAFCSETLAKLHEVVGATVASAIAAQQKATAQVVEAATTVAAEEAMYLSETCCKRASQIEDPFLLM